MEKERIEWIDILKGFAIFIIVLGHSIGYSNNLTGLSKYLSSFYVPLFFFISGYLFKNNKNETIKDYFKRKFKKILIPYFVFATLSLIPFYIFGSSIQDTLNTNKNIDSNLLTSFLNIIYASGHSKGLEQNSPLWFLPCYFSVVIIAKIIANKIKKQKATTLMVIFFTIGLITYKFLNFCFPYCLETALVMLYFYYLGMSMQNININKRKKILIISIISLLIGFILQLFNGRISCMNNNYANSYLIFIISATFTCIGYMHLFKLINKKECKIIKYLGRHTIPILVMHKMPLVFFQSKIKFINAFLTKGNTPTQLITSLIICIISIALSIIAYKITYKYCPFIYGEAKKNKLNFT